MRRLHLVLGAWSVGFGSIAGLSAAAVLAAGVGWAVVHTRARFAWWDRSAAAPLTEEERAALARCDERLGWGTWLRVLAQDADVPCGEAYVAEEVASRVHGGDRSRWLAARNADPAAPAGLRARAAAALALSGTTPPTEAAWLLPSLPIHRRTAWTSAAARSQALAVQLGPAGRAFGLAAAARDGELDAWEASGALRFLALADDPLADGAVEATATAILDVDSGLPERAELRRGTLARVPRSWWPILRAHSGCEPRCASLWIALLEETLTARAQEAGEPPPPDPAEDPDLGVLTSVSGASADRRAASAWAVGALTEWVVAAPDPASRLRALVARPADVRTDPVALAWDGSGSPFVTAAVARAIATRAGLPLEVRARPGEVWVRVGEDWAVRSCGTAAATPPEGEWSWGSIAAGALLERAAAEPDPLRAFRLATFAARLDPVLAGPTERRLAENLTAASDAGLRIGGALPRPLPPPGGAEDARRAVAEAGVTCSGPS